jgi:pimeloyl-ACP methyl ester carboxylesterase
MIAQELALLHPDRVSSLTLLATHAGGPQAWLPPAKGIFRFLATHLGPPEKRAASMAKLLYPKGFLEQVDHQVLRERMTFQMGVQPKRETLRKQLAAIRRHDTRRRLEKLRMPTLIVKPELDILVNPRHSDRLKRGIKHAKVMKLPAAGHGVIFQCAEEVNQRLLAHFESASASTPE